MNAGLAALAAYHRHFGVGYLAHTSLVTKLCNGFSDVQHPTHGRLREVTTMRIHWEFSAELDAAIFDKRAAFALLAEAVIFQGHDHGKCKSVMQLRRVDVGRCEPGHLESASR